MLLLPAKKSYLMLYARTCEKCGIGNTNTGLGFSTIYRSRINCGKDGLTKSHAPSKYVLSIMANFLGARKRTYIKRNEKIRRLCVRCHEEYTKIEDRFIRNSLRNLCDSLVDLHENYIKEGNNEREII